MNKLKWKVINRYEKWRYISSKKRRRIISVSLLALFILCFGIRSLVLHRYDSIQKLESIYFTNKETFHSTVEHLISLPVHPDSSDNALHGSTIIKLDGSWNPIGSYVVCQKQEELWICSPQPYTEKEYQMIYDVTMPLLQQARINTIVLSPDRHFVDFKVCVNSSCLDCIFYQSDTRPLNTNEYLEHYYSSYHYRYAHLDSSVANDITPIDEYWYASTAAYYF